MKRVRIAVPIASLVAVVILACGFRATAPRALLLLDPFFSLSSSTRSVSSPAVGDASSSSSAGSAGSRLLRPLPAAGPGASAVNAATLDTLLSVLALRRPAAAGGSGATLDDWLRSEEAAAAAAAAAVGGGLGPSGPAGLDGWLALAAAAADVDLFATAKAAAERLRAAGLLVLDDRAAAAAAAAAGAAAAADDAGAARGRWCLPPSPTAAAAEAENGRLAVLLPMAACPAGQLPVDVRGPQAAVPLAAAAAAAGSHSSHSSPMPVSLDDAALMQSLLAHVRSVLAPKSAAELRIEAASVTEQHYDAEGWTSRWQPLALLAVESATDEQQPVLIARRSIPRQSATASAGGASSNEEQRRAADGEAGPAQAKDFVRREYRLQLATGPASASGTAADSSSSSNVEAWVTELAGRSWLSGLKYAASSGAPEASPDAVHIERRVDGSDAAQALGSSSDKKSGGGWQSRVSFSSNGQPLSVMSYNVWNYNSDWPRRRTLIAEQVRKADPDIIGWQEVRQQWTEDDSNQLMHLVSLLPGYQYWYTPASVYPAEETEEGLGVFVKEQLPVLGVDFVKLPWEFNCTDSNTRAVLHVSLSVGGHVVNFFNTHWSYLRECQVANAFSTWEYVNAFERAVITADFNCYVDYDFPIRFLTGQELINGVRGNFVDCWTKAHPDEAGFTFRSWELHTRADRILAQPDGLTVVDFKLIGLPVPGQQQVDFASDHLGLLVQLNVT